MLAPESVGGGLDSRQRALLADFLGSDSLAKEAQALSKLQKDAGRMVSGMTPRERVLAEGIDVAREAAPVVAANVGVAGAAGIASYAVPELRPYLGGVAGVGFLAGAGIEVAANTLVRMEAHFPRAAEVAKRIAAGRLGRWIMMLSLAGGVGTAVGGIMDSYLMARAQPAAGAGGGEGLADHHPGSVDGSIGQVGGLSPGERGEGAIVQPPGETGGAGAQPAPEVVPGAGVIPSEDLLPQPGDEEAIAAADKNRAILEASTSAPVAGQDLAGGTVLSHELEFIKGLGDINHVRPVANMLKNFDAILSQPQAFVEIGPDDKAQLINRELAPWLARQLDGVVGGDPSTFDQNRKLLWDIGVAGRRATQEEFGQIVRWFVDNINK